MMRRAKQLVGLPVVELATGKHLASIRALLIDLKEGQLVALVVQKSGWLTGGKALLLTQLHAIGDDAVILRDGEELVSVSDIVDNSPHLVTDDCLSERLVMTEDGKALGALSDVDIDSQGRIMRYVLSDGLLQSLINGRSTIPVPSQAVFGEDSIIISTQADRVGEELSETVQFSMEINPPD